MRGEAIWKIVPCRDVCVFCRLRLPRTPHSNSLYYRNSNQSRSYRASRSSARPPAAAYAVAEDDRVEAPQSIQPSSPVPKPSPGAWPSFVPKRPLQSVVQPPPRHEAEHAPSETSHWKCPGCGNINLGRRDVCVSCQVPKTGPLQNSKKQLPKPVPRRDSFPTRTNNSTGKIFAEDRQRQRPFDFGRSISEVDRERPAWRYTKFGPRDGQSSTSPQGGQENPSHLSFPGRLDRERLPQEPERTGRFSFVGNQRYERQRREHEPVAATDMNKAHQLFPSKKYRNSREEKPDAANMSGLEALLKHVEDTKKATSQPGGSPQAPIPFQRFRADDPTPDASTNMNESRNGSKVSSPSYTVDGFKLEIPVAAAETLLDGDEDGVFGTGRGRQRTALEGKQDEPAAEEGRRGRGRFQAGLEEPQVAEAKVEPRWKRKGARRGASRRMDYEEGDAEEGFLEERRRRKTKSQSKNKTVVPAKTPIQLPEFISVENLATALRVRMGDFISRMEEMGFERPRHDHVLDAETSGLIASEFDFEPTYGQENRVHDLVARPPPEDVSEIPPRPPIVTIMGHVDHGKTTILDWLRKSSIVESEHGGITQHIGAFSVTMPGGKQITFLDTPGHAAFLDMRRRGANVTDIVILVVAADDSIKQQTVEAIKHATDAKVPIIVAINKVDKEDANVDRVKQDLARHGVTVEDYGGEVQAIPVSGKFGHGMTDLEEATVTLSELLDHRAETDGPVEGWIIESKVTTGGRVATVLVRRGTLRPGDIIVAGRTWARIRTLRNEAGVLVDEAPPSTPVQIDGWRGDDPIAGWEVLQADDEDHAKDVVELRLEKEEFRRLASDTAAINVIRAEEAEARAKVLAWEAEQGWASKRASRRPKDNTGWVEGKQTGGPRKVHFVVKADVSGSVEAIVNSVSAIGNNEIAANVIRSGVGVLHESDVHHLASSGEVGYLISFNQPVDGSIARLAAAAGLEILDHNIIYKVIDVVREKMIAELPPLITQRVVGEAEIGKVFEISVKKGKNKVAGCRISNGTISRDKKIRILRGSKVLYDGTLNSLKDVKKDVTEMRKGSECGMSFDNWDEFQQGDQVQCYEELKTARTL